MKPRASHFSSNLEVKNWYFVIELGLLTPKQFVHFSSLNNFYGDVIMYRCVV